MEAVGAQYKTQRTSPSLNKTPLLPLTAADCSCQYSHAASGPINLADSAWTGGVEAAGDCWCCLHRSHRSFGPPGGGGFQARGGGNLAVNATGKQCWNDHFVHFLIIFI